jgi:hypothetical protein
VLLNNRRRIHVHRISELLRILGTAAAPILVLACLLVAVAGAVAPPTGLAHSQGDIAHEVLRSVPNVPDSRDPA